MCQDRICQDFPRCTVSIIRSTPVSNQMNRMFDTSWVTSCLTTSWTRTSASVLKSCTNRLFFSFSSFSSTISSNSSSWQRQARAISADFSLACSKTWIRCFPLLAAILHFFCEQTKTSVSKCHRQGGEAYRHSSITIPNLALSFIEILLILIFKTFKTTLENRRDNNTLDWIKDLPLRQYATIYFLCPSPLYTVYGPGGPEWTPLTTDKFAAIFDFSLPRPSTVYSLSICICVGWMKSTRSEKTKQYASWNYYSTNWTMWKSK